jgi:diacylglycerol O-acyltransferase
MERLSALDTEFLFLEDGVSHMHIAGMSVFDGDAPTEDEISALIASKLHLMPRYRQVVRPVPFELGRPVWVDDAHLALEHHIRSTALPEATDEALCRLMGRLMSQELDRDRPLWECWIVHNLPDGRWALIEKVHHCMVDGVAGVGLLNALLDVERCPEPGDPVPWTPAPDPSDAALVVDAWSGLAADVWEQLTRLPTVVRHPWRSAGRAAGTATGIVRFLQDLRATEPTPVDGTIGPHRRWAHASVRLDDVRTIRRRFGGTVNDVVLAAVTNGYRQLLVERGLDPTGTTLRSLVPISVRAASGADGDGGNRVSALLYELPVDITDARERLVRVATQLTVLKGSHMADAGVAVTTFADLVPPMLMGNVSRLLVHLAHDRSQHSINTVTTNVPGPQVPLYCLGRELIEQRPFVPISHGLRFGTAILSYNGTLCFGITADEDTGPDVQVIADGIVAGITDLLEVSS